MVGEHLGVILRTPEPGDPLRSDAVLRDALGARDLSIRDVADERVSKRKLALALQ